MKCLKGGNKKELIVTREEFYECLKCFTFEIGEIKVGCLGCGREKEKVNDDMFIVCDKRMMLAIDKMCVRIVLNPTIQVSLKKKKLHKCSTIFLRTMTF